MKMKTMFKKLNLSLLVVLSVSCIAPYTYSAMQSQKPTIDALRTAIKMDNGDRVQALIKAGVDVNAIYSDGETPLLLAIKVQSLDAVQALIKAGANVNIAGKDGKPPLRTAIESRWCNDHWQFYVMSIIQALIKAGADVNAIYSDGETPLLLAINVAVSNGTSDIVLALLDAGANMDIKDKNGVTPERRLISLYAGTDYGTSEAYKNKKILMMRFMLRKP